MSTYKIFQNYWRLSSPKLLIGDDHSASQHFFPLGFQTPGARQDSKSFETIFLNIFFRSW